MSSFPCLARVVSCSGQVRYRLGERLVDRYLEFVAGRCRPNTLRAVAFDLKAFFVVTGKDPVEVRADRAGGAGAADAAADLVAGRSRPAGGRAAQAPGPGDGAGDAAGRAAPVRGAGAAVAGRAGR